MFYAGFNWECLYRGVSCGTTHTNTTSQPHEFVGAVTGGCTHVPVMMSPFAKADETVMRASSGKDGGSGKNRGGGRIRQRRW